MFLFPFTTGFGFIGASGPTSELQPDHLQMAEVSYFDRETCADLWYNSSSVVIDDTMMCTSGEVARICTNDRGGTSQRTIIVMLHDNVRMCECLKSQNNFTIFMLSPIISRAIVRRRE